MLLAKYKFKNQYVNVFLLGIITAFVIFLPFLIKDHGLFLYYGDFDVQQIPFYRLAHDAIRSGTAMWDWHTDLGVNFVGSYSFYLLGSPFFWLTIPFPSAAVPYLMAPLLILKFGLTCVTSYAYINRFTRTSQVAMLGALLYSFSGFNIYNIFFNHFHEVVLFFPLLLIALEELVINNRRGGFALTVALCATVNYYFFFGQVIFVIIYFIFRCMSKDFRVTFKLFLIIAFEAVMGLLLSAALLLPSIMAITGNSRIGDTLAGFESIIYGNSQRYGLIFSSFLFPPDIPARPNFFPDSNAKWSSVSMYLPMISIAGIIAFFKGSKKHWAKKLIVASVIISVIPILNAAFSAFNYSYYARWFYMPLLVMALVSCIAIERYMKHFKLGLIITACLVGAFSFIGILPKKEGVDLKFFALPPYPDRFWAYIAVAVIGILLTALLYSMGTRHKHFYKTAIIGVMSLTVLYSTFMIYTGKQSGEGYETIAQKALPGRDIMVLDEQRFYRIDTFDEMDNLGMYWNMPTINAFHSVVPPSIMEYYKEVGSERGVASRPKTNFIGVRALTSVKYAFTKENKGESSPLIGFEYLNTQNGYNVFENQYFVPMGFTFDYFLTDSQFDICAKEFKDRLLLKGIYLEEKDAEKYMGLLPTLENQYAYDDELGDEQYFESCIALAQNAVSSFEYDNNGFTAKISTDKKNLAFFSVPYDEGWSATVNGVPVDVVKANKGFMAVLVPQGNSVIDFEYQTPGLVAGLIITIIVGLMLAGYIYYVGYLRKNNKTLYYYDKYAHLRNRDDMVDDEVLALDAYVQQVSKQEDEEKPPE